MNLQVSQINTDINIDIDTIITQDLIDRIIKGNYENVLLDK